jgi:transforming growth factor-beta-induced protein
MMRTLKLIVPLAALLALAGVGASAAPARVAETPPKTIVETAVEAGSFTTLVSLVQAAGLVDALSGPGPFTVFAPTDEAFAKVPKPTLEALAADPAKLRAVLLYHVVPGAVPSSAITGPTAAKTLNGANVQLRRAGGTVMVDNARVLAADVQASNGVIHVVDTVLIPKPAAAPRRTIAQTAAATGSFKTLTALLRQAGLAGTLGTKGPYTVFAPTDAAFAKVPKRTLAALAKDKAKLRAVLLYHVAPGNLGASTVAKRTQVRTLNGASLRIRASGGAVRVGGARVVRADVAASNGVIHAIDRVLIP